MPLGDGTDATASRLLASCLFNATGPVPVVKFYDYATTLYKGDPIEVDNSDYELLFKFVENHGAIPVISKRQIMQMFTDAKSKG